MSIYGKNFYWWVGVVEDRKDPLSLGRCRVRILGYHTDDKSQLPTTDLPWAFPLQPVTSAAMNGIGHAPVGPVEGTWVMGFFRDGESCQDPVMMGTMGGISGYDIYGDSVRTPTPAEKKDDSVLKDGSGNTVVDGSGNPVKVGEPETPVSSNGVIGPLSQTDVDKLFAAIGKKESNGNYSAINTIGFMGKYQFGIPALEDLGYIKSGTTRTYQTQNLKVNDARNDDGVWTGKDGVSSLSSFLSNKQAQENAMLASQKNWFKRLQSRGILSANPTREETAGYLAVCHLKGIGKGGASDYANGADIPDAYGTKPSTYYALGVNAIGGTSTTPPKKEEEDPSLKAANEQEKKAQQASNNKGTTTPNKKADAKRGFRDPNKMYPLREYAFEPDTNRLAYRNKISKTIVRQKDNNRTTGIAVANKTAQWEQPLSPYNATYPYNHVYQSESGHVMEFDDSPKNERVQIYHRKGSFVEWDANGTQVNKIVGNSYQIIDRDGYISITGKCVITVEGSSNIYVKNNADIQVDGNANLNVGKNLNTTVNGNHNLNVGGAFNIRAATINAETTGLMGFKAGGKFDINAGGDIAGDAPNVHWNSGVAAAAGAGLSAPGGVLSPTEPTFDPLTLPSKIDSISVEYDDDLESRNIYLAQHADELEAAGVIVKDTPLGEEDKKPAPPAKSDNIVGDCLEFKAGDIPGTTKLSPNYTVAMLTTNTLVSNYPLKDHAGLKDYEIACNLRQLCLNVLEPLKAKYPTARINSGFRSSSSISGKVSQHETGQAADISFGGIPREQYKDIAAWIRDNLEFDQVILEYGPAYPGRDPGMWVHVSFNAKAAKQRKQVMTAHFVNGNAKYTQGLA